MLLLYIFLNEILMSENRNYLLTCALVVVVVVVAVVAVVVVVVVVRCGVGL